MMESLEDGMSPGQRESAREQVMKEIPLGRYAEAKNIANGVLMLASNDAKFITASKLVVDGGQTQY